MPRDYDDPRTPAPRLAAVARVGRFGLRALRRSSPALYHFLAGKRPQLRLAWGRSELHLRRDGLVRVTRPGDEVEVEAVELSPETAGQPFSPRKEGEQHGDQFMFRTPDEGLDGPVADGPLELDSDAMQAEVRRRMGERPDATDDELALDDEERSADALAGEISHLRDVLQSLDDVDDHALIKEIDDELYQLYKAVDYKMRRHHAAEAKAELGKLFKM